MRIRLYATCVQWLTADGLRLTALAGTLRGIFYNRSLRSLAAFGGIKPRAAQGAEGADYNTIIAAGDTS